MELVKKSVARQMRLCGGEQVFVLCGLAGASWGGGASWLVDVLLAKGGRVLAK